ncbi:MAG: DUF4476 domain-containing protein [Deltaproteobacteria bacterium]|nr:DUF4476 domain-containing protein [Deltaproteobacteria bacterium]
MIRSPKIVFGFSLLAVAVLLFGASRAYADAASDRAVIADTLSKLGGVAHNLAKTAAASDDRAVRKKFGPAATDVGDDLQALSRRAAKADVSYETIVKGLGPIDKDALTLVDLADEAEDKAERKSLRTQATQLQQAVAAARKIIEAYANQKEDAKVAPPAKTPIADGAFNQLVAAVRGASFDDDKVGVVKDASRGNWFTANQIATLMGLLSFDEGKIDAAVAAWPRVVDPQNSFVLYKKLAFDDSRETLRKRISR